MQPGPIETLFNYWDGVRAGRPAPRRLDIEPSRIAGILSETFMLERGSNGRYEFRLAGTRLCELFGYELRGTDFLQGWGAADRRVIDQHLAAVCDDAAVALISIEAGIDTRHRLELETILLPLVHGSGIDRVIGAMTPASSPHWLDKGRLTSRRLLRHELIRSGQPREPITTPSDRQRPFPTAMAAQRIVRSERRQFRVLDGGLAAAKPGKP